MRDVHRPGSTAGRIILRGRIVTPVVAIFVLRSVTDLPVLRMYTALRGKLDVGDPIPLILPGAFNSTGIVPVLAPVAVALYKHFAEREQVAW